MKVNKKLALMVASVSMLTIGFTGVAKAHVVVRPGDVKTGAYQTFTVSVPVEKDSPTVKVKLEIPMGVASVTPTVKPGWTIQTEKHDEDGVEMVNTITWTGSEIGPGLRDEFTFSAKTPDQPTDLQWKAYQTYQDGTVVSWDQQPSNEEQEGGITGPFSVTKVASESDQDKALKSADSKASNAQQGANTALYAGIGGGVLALIALIVALSRKPKASSQL